MKYLLTVLLFLSNFSLVFAGDSSTGCGLGWKVTKSMTTTGASTRVSTNGTFSSTIGMTMGTSGCKRHSIVLKEKMKIYYIENNYDFLVQDIARGEGEYLDGLVRIFGCKQSFSSQLKSSAKKNLEKLLNGHSPENFLKDMDVLTKNCSHLSSV